MVLHINKTGEEFVGVSGGRVVGRRGVRRVGILNLDLLGSAEEGLLYRHQCRFENALPDEGAVLYFE